MIVYGPQILARSIASQRIPDRFGNVWQYHPQSDKHSKIACWGVMFDLMANCQLLRHHIEVGKVGFGINHTMTDFSSDRSKDLDLVISIPRSEPPSREIRFRDLVDDYGIQLDTDELRVLEGLPSFSERPVGDVLLALEAKAAMGAHVRAGPRLFDELTSAWQCINGSAPQAIAVALGMVNASNEFISPKMNRHELATTAAVVGRENQPNGALHIQRRFHELRVRDHTSERGYDAVGVITVAARNDGGTVSVVDGPPALPQSDSMNYERMILRVVGLYDGRFASR